MKTIACPECSLIVRRGKFSVHTARIKLLLIYVGGLATLTVYLFYPLEFLRDLYVWVWLFVSCDPGRSWAGLSYSHAQSIMEQAAPDKYEKILASFCWQIACEQMVELSDLVKVFPILSPETIRSEASWVSVNLLPMCGGMIYALQSCRWLECININFSVKEDFFRVL